MSIYKSTIQIKASKQMVFKTISEIKNFSKAIPDIVDIDILTDTKKGVGTRFRETRLIMGKKTSTILEITEYEANNHVRIVSISGGTTWDSNYRLKENNDIINLTLEMEAIPHTIFSRITNIFIKGMLQRALDKDMKSVKKYCEQEK